MSSDFGEDSTVRRGTARYAKNAYVSQISKLSSTFSPRNGYSVELVNKGLLAASTEYACSLEAIKTGIGVYALSTGTSVAAIVDNQVNLVDDKETLLSVPADEFFQVIAKAMNIDFTRFHLKRLFSNIELQSSIFAMRSVAGSLPQVTPSIIDGNLVAIYGTEVKNMIKAAATIRDEALGDDESRDGKRSDDYVI